jgi:hypothetical protein
VPGSLVLVRRLNPPATHKLDVSLVVEVTFVLVMFSSKAISNLDASLRYWANKITRSLFNNADEPWTEICWLPTTGAL